MDTPVHVLLIAPDAPPKNTTEAIQARRILTELDKHVSGHVVSALPVAAGTWGQHDASLELGLKNFDAQALWLPFHRFTSRVVMSHRLARFHVPDPVMWISWMAGRVLRSLRKRPDIIYSRSSPMSSALLARKIQKKLGVPWIMHLSDPWADNPHAAHDPRSDACEAACFRQASLITLTTEGQAEHYRKKYPAFAHKIIVLPNVMPDEEETRAWAQQPEKSAPDPRLKLIYAGSLYSSRSPAPLMEALRILRETEPEVLASLHIDVYGNAQEDCLKMLEQEPGVIKYHGPVSFRKAYAAQAAADAALNIDAEMSDPLCKHFLPTKVVDCLAMGKPLLAITPEGSETARLCAEGYGWAAAPSRPQEIAACIARMVQELPKLRAAEPKAPPACYSAKAVVQNLVAEMRRLVSVHQGGGHSA